MDKDIKFQEDYKYGFKDEDVSVLKTEKGLNEEIVRKISKYKNEPEWMLEFRLKALRSCRLCRLHQEPRAVLKPTEYHLH